MPRGVSLRASLAPRAQKLRGEGWKLREISELLGVPLQTVAEWCVDPDGAKHKARRRLHAGACKGCGGPTDSSHGLPSAYCVDCVRWSDDEIIDAMREWAEAHGGIGPTCQAWTKATVFHPSAGVVVKRMGWNVALRRAGLGLRRATPRKKS